MSVFILCFSFFLSSLVKLPMLFKAPAVEPPTPGWHHEFSLLLSLLRPLLKRTKEQEQEEKKIDRKHFLDSPPCATTHFAPLYLKGGTTHMADFSCGPCAQSILWPGAIPRPPLLTFFNQLDQTNMALAGPSMLI